MDAFTYLVFVVVASTIGALLTLFVGVITTALLFDLDDTPHAVAEPRREPQLSYRQAA